LHVQNVTEQSGKIALEKQRQAASAIAACSAKSSTRSLWVKVRAAQLPDPPVPGEVKEAELDELFTFIGDKKPNICHHHCRSGCPLLFWASKWSGSEPKK